MESRLEANRDSIASSLDQLPIHSQSTTTNDEEIETRKALLEKSKILPKNKKSKRLQAILNPKIKATRKYFTTGSTRFKNVEDSYKEHSTFEYPKNLEEFAHRVMTRAWRNDVRVKELALKCSKKPGFRERQARDILERLYVEDPPGDTMKTVLDVDPQYFNVIEGRPIPDKLDIREYIRTVRDTLRTKIITGYREDDIMLIEENLLTEQKMIDTILENYQTYVNAFEEFLYRDHSSAMQLLKESDQAANEAYDAYEEYKKLAKKYGALRSSLYNSEEKWRNCKMYQKFLYSISPVSWKSTQQKFRRTSVYMMEESDDDDEENIFGKYRLSLAERGASLRDILILFREECMDDRPPQLYFVDPEQLMDVFRFMEMQNLNSLLHCEELAIPLEHVKEGMKIAEYLFDVEIDNLQSCIARLSGGISWEEGRAQYLEELGMNLIENEFKKMVMDDKILNLHVYVEDVYETRIGPNDANLSMVEMMKAIEEKYRHELLSLDKVPSEQVQLLEGSCYAEQVRVMRLAEKAAKQYAELERLTYRLNKAFAPPPEKLLGKRVKKRSPPIEPLKTAASPPRSLTEEEQEYLEYFTDFCKQTDDPKNYGIDTRVGAMKNASYSVPRAYDHHETKAQYVGRVQGLSVVERMIMTNT